MSKDPKTKQAPPAAAPVETLEDAVYRPSISESYKELHGTDPLVAIPTAIITYVCAAGLIFLVATQTEAGKKALKKTTGVTLVEEGKDDVDDLPPPPPPPAAPVMALTKVEIKDVPPPPPLNDQEVVPDVAPKVIPTLDLSKIYAQQDTGDKGSSGLGSTVGTGTLGATTSTNVAADISSSDVQVTYQPPKPQYPPMAQKAKISGTVVLELTIGTDGSVHTARALSGPAVFHQYAVDWAKKWRFTPYAPGGHAQMAKFIIELKFTQ